MKSYINVLPNTIVDSYSYRHESNYKNRYKINNITRILNTMSAEIIEATKK